MRHHGFLAFGIALMALCLLSSWAQAATVHVVKPGETPYLIARQYGVTVDHVLSVNAISDPRNLLVGTRLLIGDDTRTHVVKKGETLYVLSKRYGVSVTDLASANAISNPYNLLTGTVLIIPGNERPSGAQALPWSTVNNLFPRHGTARVTDVRTGLSFDVWRRGGWAHADVEPRTWSDANTLRRIYGGRWSWLRRPIIVEVGGYRIAASMNGMPHGGQAITSNGFPGHHCIHFMGSTTHGTKRLDPNHQVAVREAVGK